VISQTVQRVKFSRQLRFAQQGMNLPMAQAVQQNGLPTALGPGNQMMGIRLVGGQDALT